MFEQHLIRRALSASLLVAGASFPAAAQARPWIDPPAAATAPSVERTAPSIERTASGGGSGFHWGDAGIGAGAAVLLVGTGGAVAGGARRRRVQRAVAS
jgi:hypothetical protein